METKQETAEQFFYREAGYSYDPKKETKAQGRRRCARILADAERRASEAGISFQWEIDMGASSADWIADDEDGGRNKDPWAVWECVARDGSGKVIASLCGIDFGRDGEPWGDPYRRVVEAELALEGLED